MVGVERPADCVFGTLVAYTRKQINISESIYVTTLTKTPNSTVLVVDDNLEVLRAMSDLLQYEGFSVRTAQNGLDALNRMKSDHQISLVLLDLWMPVMDGGNFCAERRPIQI
jgi:PleD family two-component response regulator